MAQHFVLNDETAINSYGFVVENAGGRLQRFMANSVMLGGHNSDNVLGSWANLQTTNGQITAEPQFDEADPEALKVKGKVDRGYLKGASIGIVVHAMDYKMKDGKMVLHATDWELLEASIVSVPSNANCLRLYNTKGEHLQSAAQIQLNINSFINKHTMTEIKLTAEAFTALGVEATANEAAILIAIIGLQKKVTDAEATLAAAALTTATALVDKAVDEGRITADKKADFVTLAVADYKQAASILEAIPAKQTLSTQLKAPSTGGEDKSTWDFRKYQKEDPKGLAKMHAENFDAYEALRLAYGTL